MQTIRNQNDPLLPTIDDLREYLGYDPATGLLFWIKKPANRVNRVYASNHAGPMHAGHKYKHNITIGFKGVLYRAHRLAWAIHHGEWPAGCIDHINGDPHDNRLANLRVCSQQQNSFNARLRSDNTSGIKGVYYRKDRGRWAAQIHHNGKKKSLGCYPTAELAAAAYDKAAKETFGEFASPNHTLGTQHKTKTKRITK